MAHKRWYLFIEVYKLFLNTATLDKLDWTISSLSWKPVCKKRLLNQIYYNCHNKLWCTLEDWPTQTSNVSFTDFEITVSTQIK